MRNSRRELEPAVRSLARALVVALALAGCARRDPRPSFLVVVLDTTRADAVSAYGAARDTTPNVDALARTGVRYTRAYAQAPWTLPSHATLFTGLLPSAHHVSWAQTRADDRLTTVAEVLARAGYETFGVSENPWVSAAFNMTQGFAAFRDVKGFTLDPATPPDDGGVERAVAEWLDHRTDVRPFFLFVNVLDAHLPYLVRTENPYLPPGVDAAAARAIPQSPDRYFCSAEPHVDALAVLHGLYLGGVHAADRKLGAVRALLHAHGADGRLVTIVTADHGEHFGEHRLVGHQFSVRDPLLHVPLVVHGPGVPTAVVDTPVALADVMPTMLALAAAPIPGGLAGKMLPFDDDPKRAAARAIVAEQDDSDAAHVDDPDALAAALRAANRAARLHCTDADRVFGALRALMRGDRKLIWYEQHPPQLYDLRDDPGEDRDLAADRATETAALTAELGATVAGAAESSPLRDADTSAPAMSAAPPPSAVRERLRALGYVGDAVPPTAPAEPSAASAPTGARPSP